MRFTLSPTFTILPVASGAALTSPATNAPVMFTTGLVSVSPLYTSLALEEESVMFTGVTARVPSTITMWPAKVVLVTSSFVVLL